MNTTRFIDTIPRNSRRRYRITAHHEAGHAIVAFRLGLRVPREVSIVPEGETLGRVRQKPWPASVQPEVQIGPRDRVMIKDQIVAFLAGHEAERRFTGRSNGRGAASDFSAAAGLALRIGDDGEGASAFLRWCSFRTRRIVAFNWKSIRTFARALLGGGELRGAKLKDALDEATLVPGTTLEQLKELRASLRESAEKIKAARASNKAGTTPAVRTPGQFAPNQNKEA